MKQLLTHSRKDCFKTCRRKHEFCYEIGLRRIDDAKALRIGKAVHAGIESLGNDDNLEAACNAVRKCYAIMPETFDPMWWDYERETVLRLVCAYQWRWQDAKLQTIAVEFAFEIPLVNPATGAESTIWNQAGKIDGIVKLEDSRMAVKETKTTSDDISPDSDYWRMLRVDTQISDYIHSARVKGFDVSTVLYDVIRKPTIKPTPVPLTDEMGLKMVFDQHGERIKNANGSWKQTGDSAKGYEIQTRPMTVQEWGNKLSADITERPDYYFSRVEIPRLDQDIEECRQENWEIQQTIREAQRTGRHYRTVNRNTCPYCPYFDVCSSNLSIDPAQLPAGFEIVQDVHPELERERSHANNSTATQSTAACAAASPTAV